MAILTYYLSRRATERLEKATFVKDYTSAFYSDQAMVSLFFEIDYGRFKFSKELLGTEKEIQLTKLLDMMNSIGFNVSKGVIDIKDIDETTLGYAILRTYLNPEVQKYLKHVDDYSKDNNIRLLAFGYFRKLGEEISRRYCRSVSPNSG